MRFKGFEDEQRIGKELTVEGATPIERLDFALQTKHAEEGMEPLKVEAIEDRKSQGREALVQPQRFLRAQDYRSHRSTTKARRRIRKIACVCPSRF